jgi:hypothetical protein
MAEEASPPVDFWSVLEDAKETVEKWPDWQQRYEADTSHEPPVEGVVAGGRRSVDPIALVQRQN